MERALIIEKRGLAKASYRNDALKIMAMVTMLIDHIGYIYFSGKPGYMMYRTIGRLAFPIFAYQIAVGYSKTSNLRKYVERLLIFALISQIPYTFFNPELKFHPLHFNVLFMFLAAILVLYVYDMGIKKIRSFIEDKNFGSLLLGILLLAGTVFLTILPEIIGFMVKEFSFEYGGLGIAMVLVFHIFREKSPAAIISVILLYFAYGYYMGALYTTARTAKAFWKNFFNFRFVWSQITFNNGLLHLQRYYINARGVFSLIPIYLLQGMDTSRIKLNKYIGYTFYPAHITIIIIIAYILRTV